MCEILAVAVFFILHLKYLLSSEC